MHSTLRDAWKNQVLASDYEAHMAAIGQARANAEHLREMLSRFPPPPGAMVWLAGAGPGQMFDYLPEELLSPWRLVCSDISERFLGVLRTRCRRAECVVEDLLQPALAGECHTAVVVLVLEHIDWRRGVEALAARRPKQIFVVIQENPEGMQSAVSPQRVLPGSMVVFGEAHPELLEAPALVKAFAARGYGLAWSRPAPVADGKTMLGLVFRDNGGVA
jgi:hypothetical protein